MKTSSDIKTYLSDEQLEQFKRKNGIETDSEAVLFLLNEISKYATNATKGDER